MGSRLVSTSLFHRSLGVSLPCRSNGQASYANAWVPGAIPIRRSAWVVGIVRSPPRNRIGDAWPHLETTSTARCHQDIGPGSSGVGRRRGRNWWSYHSTSAARRIRQRVECRRGYRVGRCSAEYICRRRKRSQRPHRRVQQRCIADGETWTWPSGDGSDGPVQLCAGGEQGCPHLG